MNISNALTYLNLHPVTKGQLKVTAGVTVAYVVLSCQNIYTKI